MRVINIHRLVFAIATVFAVGTPLFGQQGATGAPPLAAQSANQTPAMAAPQVNPVVHRLSGLNMLAYLRRRGVRVAPLSDETFTSNHLQTSIAAGLSLEDGSIVARLPRAELEISKMSPGTPALPSNSLQDATDLFVMHFDGREVRLKLMGLDGGTGLSLLQAEDIEVVASTRDVKEESLTLGQHVRLLFPGRASQTVGVAPNQMFVNIGELEGNITSILRSRSGMITRLTVSAENLSPSALGAIAINDAGETIGLVDANTGREAGVIPVTAVRRAVARIRTGIANQSRPWLGARGNAVADISRKQLESIGWASARATNLIANQIGVVLTSVTPMTPASVANLRVGDVVVSVNGGEVGSAEEFSSLLTEESPKGPVRFTVIRPGQEMPHVVSVKLNLSLDPVLDTVTAEERATRLSSSDPLVARGMETLPITAELASRLKVRGGRFVVFVHHASAASRAGVLAGDIIESINSKLLSRNSLPFSIQGRMKLDVVRNGKNLTIQIETKKSSPAGSQL